MKVWRLEIDFGEHESFQLANKDKLYLREFKQKILSGKVLHGKLDNTDVELVAGELPSDLPKFWSVSGTMIFSEKAKRCLENLIRNCVEFIPLRYHGQTIYIANVFSILDGINYNNVILRKLDTGLVVGVERYSFTINKIEGYNMFKIMLRDRIFSTEIYVSTDFKNKVEENMLVGFKFCEVWDSDDAN